MKLILTSSLGGAVKLNGKRLPCGFPTENKLPDTLRACWKSPSRVILIAASPGFYEKNDDLAACFRQSFPLNGLPISALELCDARNPELAAQICEADVLMFPGGHVPTQNAFYHRLQLRQRLRAFSGLVIAWSAGSMNCAETVYAALFSLIAMAAEHSAIEAADQVRRSLRSLRLPVTIESQKSWNILAI